MLADGPSVLCFISLFCPKIFGYRNCRMSLILLHWWIISEPGNTNCLGSYSFNLRFVVEEISLSFPPAISPLLPLPSHQPELMVFPCNVLAVNSFSCPFSVRSGFSIQLSSHFSLCHGSCPFLWSAPVTDSLPATRLRDSCQPGFSHASKLPCRSISLCSMKLVHKSNAGVECWCKTTRCSSQRHLAHRWLFHVLLPAARTIKHTSLLWANKHHQPKAHNASKHDVFTSKYDFS